MNAKKIARRRSALERFKILSFYDWAGENYGGVGSVPDDHETLYASYVSRKNIELKSLKKGA